MFLFSFTFEWMFIGAIISVNNIFVVPWSNFRAFFAPPISRHCGNTISWKFILTQINTNNCANLKHVYSQYGCHYPCGFCWQNVSIHATTTTFYSIYHNVGITEYRSMCSTNRGWGFNLIVKYRGIGGKVFILKYLQYIHLHEDVSLSSNSCKHWMVLLVLHQRYRSSQFYSKVVNILGLLSCYKIPHLSYFGFYKVWIGSHKYGWV